MNTDTTPFSVPAVWSVRYSLLKGTLWDDYELDLHRYRRNEPSDHAPVVNALEYVFNLAKDWEQADPEDSVLAVIKAAHQHHGTAFLTPEQVKEMARNFTVFYPDLQEPRDEYLEEFCGEARWNWLNEYGREQVDLAIIRSTEIWVMPVKGPQGVWVFDKPGS